MPAALDDHLLQRTAGYGHRAGKKEAKVKSPAIREARMVPADLHHVASFLDAPSDSVCARNYMPCPMRGQAFFGNQRGSRLDASAAIETPAACPICHRGIQYLRAGGGSMSRLVEQVSSRIRQLRQQSGYTLEELGARLGMKGHSVWRIETGRRTPSLELIEKLTEIYGVRPDYFFADSTESLSAKHAVKELDPLLRDLWQEWNQFIHCEHAIDREQAAAILRAVLHVLRESEAE